MELAATRLWRATAFNGFQRNRITVAGGMFITECELLVGHHLACALPRRNLLAMSGSRKLG